jgi:DNA invertase Pin-like site-specific DNA recombinase
MSGAKDRRPGLERLLLDARRARVQVVVCWALDRIGRDLKHLLAVLEDLQSLSIPFVSLKEGLDLDPPAAGFSSQSSRRSVSSNASD